MSSDNATSPPQFVSGESDGWFAVTERGRPEAWIATNQTVDVET